MIKIGKYNKLKVVKEVDFGLYLDGGDKGEILLPTRYVPEGTNVDDELEVFIYNDSEDRIIATTQQPYAEVGDFAYLKVVDVTSIGAFLDWGLPKDLFVPFKEQKDNRMKKGKWYVVRIYLDEETDRIAASARLGKFLNDTPKGYKKGDKVNLLIYARSDLGYQAVINGKDTGMIFKEDLFKNIDIGEELLGYIKKIREDGKIDLVLAKPGYEKVKGISKDILDKLENAGGFMKVTDKSDPELIYSLFGVSKRSYKKAVGSLYKKKIITIEDNGIRLNS